MSLEIPPVPPDPGDRSVTGAADVSAGLRPPPGSPSPVGPALPDGTDPTGEAVLLDAVRHGSSDAFGILYARHRDQAKVVARGALSPSDASLAEDVVEVAFTRVFNALRGGSGPTDVLPRYLATVVRREAWRMARRDRRQVEVAKRWWAEVASDQEPPTSLGTTVPTTLKSHSLLGEAFSSLSERWRQVLWLTEVEGWTPAEVAPTLGLSAGSVAALSYRARRGLLAAYVQIYCDGQPEERCRELGARLQRYLAGGSVAAGFDDVSNHLEGCGSCRDVCRGVDVSGGRPAR